MAQGYHIEFRRANLKERNSELFHQSRARSSCRQGSEQVGIGLVVIFEILFEVEVNVGVEERSSDREEEFVD